MHDAVLSLLYVLPKMYQAVAVMVAVMREDMTGRTTIAKLVAFLFVQDSVRSSTNLRNVQVLLLGTG